MAIVALSELSWGAAHLGGSDAVSKQQCAPESDAELLHNGHQLPAQSLPQTDRVLGEYVNELCAWMCECVSVGVYLLFTVQLPLPPPQLAADSEA